MPETGELILPEATPAEILEPLENNPEYQFQRREGLDDEGKKIFAYEFTNKQGQKAEAIFFSRGEPTTGGELVKDKVVVPLGSLKTREGEEKKPQAQKIIASEQTSGPLGPDYQQALQEGKVTFLVESSPQGLLDLAMHLGVQDEQIGEARKLAVVDWKFTPQVRDLIDKVIAGNIVNQEGEISNIGDKHEGEALGVKALLGDEKAKQILDNKVQSLEKDYQETLAKNLQTQKERVDPKVEALKVEDLVCVHLTRFKPTRNPETGKYEIKSTFDATQGKSPRVTVHFTLNHPVMTHQDSGWERADYAVIFPFKDGIEANGNPTRLSTIDTFWEIPVGGGLELPEGTVVVELGQTQGSLSQEGGEENGLKIVKYNEELSPKSISSIYEALKNSPIERRNLNEQVVQRLTFGLEHNHALSRYTSLGGQDADKQILWDNVDNYVANIDLEKYLSNHNIHDLVNEVYSLFPKDLVTSEDKQVGIRAVKEAFLSRVRNFAIYDQIVQKGFKTHRGGTWAWDDDSNYASSQTEALGDKLGVLVSAHLGDSSRDAEASGLRYMYGEGYQLTEEIELAREDIMNMARSDLRNKIKDIRQNQLRSLYLCGVI